jgi:hypothetical protein
MSLIGCLMRNNIENNTFAIDNKGLTFSVKFSEQRTAYLYWKDIKYLQIGNKRIFSPSSRNMTLTLKMSNISIKDTDLDWNMDMKNVTDTFRNICKKYDSNLNDLISPIINHWKSPITNNLPIIWLSVLTTMVIMHITLTIWILFRINFICKRDFIMREKSYDSLDSIVNQDVGHDYESDEA